MLNQICLRPCKDLTRYWELLSSLLVACYLLQVNCGKCQNMKSYRDLEIYQKAYTLALEVHKMSLTLPKYELFEQGSQIRRASKSIKDNIVEGYGRKRYKDDFIRFLTYSQSSCDETISQLSMINDIHFPNEPMTNLMNEYESLGKGINKFIQYVENNWKTTKNKQPETSNHEPFNKSR